MAHKGFIRQSLGVQATPTQMNLSHIRIIILESMAVRLGQKGSIYTRRNLKTIYFPGLAAKHGQEFSAGHKGTKQKNAVHTPEVHPHKTVISTAVSEAASIWTPSFALLSQGMCIIFVVKGWPVCNACYLTLFITPKTLWGMVKVLWPNSTLKAV